MSESFVDDQDWCIILANLLDNAIEASEKVADKKEIAVKLETYPYGAVINISNSYEQICLKNGQLITTKENRLGHGLGYQSIRQAVQKYKGSIEFHAEDGKFTANIVLYR